MFSRRRHTRPEDPSVAPVEELLDAAASRSEGEVPRRDGRLVVTHAVWLCACETLDDSPMWLIYAVGDDGVGWQRITEDRLDVPDVVDADHLTGGHPAPDEVLKWLRGDRPDPWGGRGDFPEDAFIMKNSCEESVTTSAHLGMTERGQRHERPPPGRLICSARRAACCLLSPSRKTDEKLHKRKTDDEETQDEPVLRGVPT